MEREEKNTNKKRRSVQKKKKYIDIKIPTVCSCDTNLQVALKRRRMIR